MNENLKGITVNGESLESYLSEEETKECLEEAQSDVIYMERIRKKRHQKTRMQTHYDKRAKRINKEKEMDTLTMEELRQVINSYSLTGAALFLLGKGHQVSGTWMAAQASEARGRDIPQGQANQSLRLLKKSSIGYMIYVKEDGNSKIHTLFPQYRNIDWKDLYKVYNNKYPDTITDLKRKYPSSFPVEQFKTMTTKEEAKKIAKENIEKKTEFEQDPGELLKEFGIETTFEKCPRCQQKALSDVGICQACGYDVDEEETIPDKFDAFTKDVINKALKDKFGQDINVNVNINITFGLK
jgi:hypothetical protein